VGEFEYILISLVTALATLADTQSSAERVLTTPLPIGYNILISQIVLLYIYVLPFQLFNTLGWITIPGTLGAAYIIIGLAAIGNELENPFGNDVNDLPLDDYCNELKIELDTLMSMPAPRFEDVVRRDENLVLWPLSESSANNWRERSEKDIRSALRAKVIVGTGKSESQANGSLNRRTLGPLLNEDVSEEDENYAWDGK
jgi:ion channel-forming bestrophin family protein